MSDEGRQLLEAVLGAEDGDDTPRLVYADWLSERGDPRGEFIHVQCALGRRLHGARGRTWETAKPYSDQDPAVLTKREKALLKNHQKAWVAPIRPYVRTWSWLRGFIDSAVCDGATYLEGASAMFSNTPLRKVQLTAMKGPHFELLRGHPTTGRLRELDVSNQKVSAVAAGIFQDPCWVGLRALNVSGNHLDVAAAKVLERARFDSLETLAAAQAGLDDDALAVLARAPYFERLHVLRLGWSQALTVRAASIIAEAGASLRELDLSAVNVGDEGAKALAASPKLKNLRKLRLDWNVGPAGVKALLDSPHLGHLCELDRVDPGSQALIEKTFAERKRAS